MQLARISSIVLKPKVNGIDFYQNTLTPPQEGAEELSEKLEGLEFYMLPKVLVYPNLTCNAYQVVKFEEVSYIVYVYLQALQLAGYISVPVEYINGAGEKGAGAEQLETIPKKMVYINYTDTALGETVADYIAKGQLLTPKDGVNKKLAHMQALKNLGVISQ